MKKTFKTRQIDILNKENELANETHKLLFDLLSSMSEEQRAKIKGHSVNDYDSIVEISKDGYTLDSGQEEVEYFLDGLSQVEQKEIIDLILSDILK